MLRPLRPDDLGVLLEVQRAGAVAGLGHIFPQDTNPFPSEEIRARWAEELDDPAVDCFAVLLDGNLAGFAATRGAELLHFGTALETWGTGLADCAHTELIEHLRLQGHPRAWLRVFDENYRAVRFYERRGWRATLQTTLTSFAPYPVLRRYELDLKEACAD